MFGISSFFGKHCDLITEDSSDPQIKELARLLKARSSSPFARSIHVRMVDAGSSNDVELEEGLTGSPQVDAERFGIHFVASPRHADVLIVSGPVTVNAKLSVKKTYEAMAHPKAVVAAGDGACTGGLFSGGYAIAGTGAVSEVIPVDVCVPGNPPSPYAIIIGILKAGEAIQQKSKTSR
ncbi:hypothetical protein HY990_01560 [Candidatus Micrarchaeota archaeon]|nr:hypothetical protein [Candidatus Micrarchaeota archaeon]